MLTKSEIVAKILQAKPNLTQEAVEQRIEGKKSSLGKLLTEEGAAYMVATELGINLLGKQTLKTRLTIRDILVGAANITITGKVLANYQARSFTRSNGVKGKVGRLVLGDETGIVNLVLWDENAEITEGRLTKGDIIRVNNGYVKEGLDGRPELHVGRKGSVVILPPKAQSEIPYTIQEVYTQTSKMREGKSINFLGYVEKVSVVSTFKRKDDRKGKVARVRVTDDAGRIIAVFWDEKTDLIQKMQRGTRIKIINGYVRRGFAETLEIHIRKESEVFILRTETPNPSRPPSLQITRIEDLTSNMSDIDVLARVIGLGQVRDFSKPSGEQGKVGELFLMDETGSIRMVLWDTKAMLLQNISAGDVVLVEGAYTRQRYGDNISLNLGNMGTVKINPNIEQTQHLPPYPVERTMIGELKAGLYVSVNGKISEKPLVKTVSTRDGREMKVTSLKIRDETGEIQASFWGGLADQLESLALETEIIVKNVYVKTGFTGELELSSRTLTEVKVK